MGDNNKPFFYIIKFELGITFFLFFLTSVQVIFIPYCCLFCVLSNDRLNVKAKVGDQRVRIAGSSFALSLFATY